MHRAPPRQLLPRPASRSGLPGLPGPARPPRPGRVTQQCLPGSVLPGRHLTVLPAGACCGGCAAPARPERQWTGAVVGRGAATGLTIEDLRWDELPNLGSANRSRPR